MSNNNLLFQALSSNGDGTGTTNLILNDSASPADYYIKPPVDELYLIKRMHIDIGDTGAFDVDKYGNGITLTNGIILTIQDASNTLFTFNPGIPIVANHEWSHLAHEFMHLTYGAGMEAMQFEINFKELFDKDIVLNGNLGEKLVVTLEDDFSGLLEHHVLVHGVIERVT